MADPAPPLEVPLAFVREVTAAFARRDYELAVVLRGSVLLRHWYGEAARPAADLDLECFESPRDPAGPARRYDDDSEFRSRVDVGRVVIRDAASGTYRGWTARPDPPAAVEFTETEVPPDGDTLWSYGTPGERYYVGWVWHAGGGQRGRLRIDLTAADAYTLADLPLAELTLAVPGGRAVRCPVYAPETLLASKVTWLAEGLRRDPAGKLTWAGECKTLFDAHLLLTAGRPAALLFQQALAAVGAQDRLPWGRLDALFTAAALTDADFAGWPAFRAEHPGLTPLGPAALLQEVAGRLEPLMGDFHRRDEMPFLLRIQEDPADTLVRLVYADWLDERGHDRRAAFLRGDAGVDGLPGPWLLQVFGTSAALRAAGAPPGERRGVSPPLPQS